MPAPAGLRFRAAAPGDAKAIAALHADSWQRHYRGAFSDAFLDHDVAGYLLPLWTERLTCGYSSRTAMPRPSTRRGAAPAWSAPKPRRQEATKPGSTASRWG